MPTTADICSRHLLRRTARNAERRLERTHPGNHYRVVKAKRGPARYLVIKLHTP